MKKYYFADVYELQGELFYSYEAMIEYVTENWEDYCLPVGDDDRKLVSLEDNDGKLILHHRWRDDDTGEKEYDTYVMEWTTRQIVWLVSELERMVARV